MDSYFKGAWQHARPKPLEQQAFCRLGDPIVLYDIGASGGMPPPFSYIPEAILPVNFEPDERSDTVEQGERFPIAIGPEALRTFYLNRRATTSSLLRPNEKVVGRYDWNHITGNEDNIFETVSEARVDTYSLDKIQTVKGLPPIDFVKIDVQGLTLELLEGGEKSLKEDVLGLQVEVEFLEAYQGQRIFGAVAELLHRHEFEVFRLSNLCPWYYKTEMPLKVRTGQDTFCDLLYFRGIDTIGKGTFWDARKAIQTIRLMLLFDLTDSAAAYLERFQTHHILGEDTFQALRDAIVSWKGALRRFYHLNSGVPEAEIDRPKILSFPQRLWNASPRKLVNYVRRRLKAA
jgi:FkbM family methyltransferase